MQLTTFKFPAMARMLLICELKSTYFQIFSTACNFQPYGHFLDSTLIVPHKNSGQLLLNSVNDSRLVIVDAAFVIQYHLL
jgi:hypothetical protein